MPKKKLPRDHNLVSTLKRKAGPHADKRKTKKAAKEVEFDFLQGLCDAINGDDDEEGTGSDS